jgi:glycosyltransferase involved in cell wall biosynthesis
VSGIRLSYVLTTYNKLSYLTQTLPLLIEAREADEEIVIVDGGSGDGSFDYLKNLHIAGKIDTFKSEKDRGEADGTNKAFLLARGEIIKLITDDDVYHIPTIRKCCDFMLANPSVDMLGCNGFGFNTNLEGDNFSITSSEDQFRVWKKTGQPFMICGLSFMFRRTSLARLGLFDVNYKIIDFEYALRITAMKASIAYYTGMGFVNIVNPGSNSSRFYAAIEKERRQLEKLYPTYQYKSGIDQKLIRLKEFILTRILRKQITGTAKHQYADVVRRSVAKLDEFNSGRNFEFLT